MSTITRTSDPAPSLADTLRQGVVDGEFDPHQPFPSFRELSRRHGVSLRVVKSALDALEREGLLYRRERRGTFIRMKPGTVEPTAGAKGLRCVTILERPTGTGPQFVRTGYFQGYTEVLEDLDIKMRVMMSPAGEGDYESVFSTKFSFQQQGCVLVNVVDRPFMEWLNERDIPFVVQNYASYDKSGLPPHHSVNINKVHGGFEATRHLIELGHQRIGFIGPVPGQAPMLGVYTGFAAAMQCAGLQINQRDVLPISTNETAMSVEPIKKFFAQVDRPTAVVGQCDALAIGALDAAKQLGLSVPGDLSIVGFDGSPETSDSDPPLATVANPRVMLGREALQMVIEAANGRYAEPQTKVLEGVLVPRSSTSPPGQPRTSNNNA